MRLHNQKHEAYAVARAAGYSQTESAKRSGFSKTSAPNAGFRLERLEPVKARIAELHAGEPDDAEVATRSWIVSNLVEIVRIGVHPDSRDLPNANRALESLAKLGGYLAEHKVADSRRPDRGRSENAELQMLLEKQMEQLSPESRAKIESFLGDPVKAF